MTSEELVKQIEVAYREGFGDGHRQGLSCGHDLSPKCKLRSEEEENFHGSRTKRTVDDLTQLVGGIYPLSSLYCDDCVHLSLKEGEQHDVGMHMCGLRNERILHRNEHPRLPRPEDCSRYITTDGLRPGKSFVMSRNVWYTYDQRHATDTGIIHISFGSDKRVLNATDIEEVRL